MFISIPKEFYVPVIFGDNYILNLDTQNMELDTEFTRDNTKYSNVTTINTKKFKSNDSGKIYVEIDDEYVSSMTDRNTTHKNNTRLKDDSAEINKNRYIESVNKYRE